ncbi:uncharacterized protein LOC133806603 [Humulus lupulus]|uniref:uncharacterized protein LOC133806603 n=1 Tax=Humulus lupulus TaxID=3486 RepID=UPI002B40990C|nr:uncharacterized protein LOC133806603 [Humulus lupulus]
MDKIFIWNVRGINKSSKQIDVMKELHNKNIGFIGLLETKVKASKMGALYLQMFKGWCFSSNLAHHPNGRIIIAWNPNSFEVDIKGGTSQFIHCVLKPKKGHRFSLTVVYAANDSRTRALLWRDLVNISEGMKIPWIVGGDFNAVLNPEERLDYRGNANELIPFQTCVNSCGLEDVKYNGRFFTWNNKQDGKNRVYAKLDRFLATSEWIDTYSTSEVSFLPEGNFDHSPALLTVYPSMQNIKKPFRYFNFWKNLNGFLDVVKQCWQEKVAGSHMYQLVFLLKQLKSGLKNLNRQGRGDVELQEKETYQQLLKIQQQLQLDPRNSDLILAEKKYRTEFSVAHKNYIQYLSQKAKVDWIKSRDENTKLFHSSLKIRRQQNTIYSIRDQNGNWVDNQEGVIKAFLEFYDSLLGSKIEGRTRVHKIFFKEGALISPSQATWLIRDYTGEEVEVALNSIPNDKAPGPDGYNSAFFKDTWEIPGKEVKEVILSFLNTEKLLKEINATTVTLVPKATCPESVSDFRPIACCNVIYKIATKMICNRLRDILPDIISENQSCFVKGRKISHNIMICQDMVRGYDRRSAKSACLFKIDL